MFWLPRMKKDIAKFAYVFLTFQKSKIEHQKLFGLMQPLDIHEWMWDGISMDFMMCFPKTYKGNDAVWDIVDILTKSTHFIPIKINYLS